MVKFTGVTNEAILQQYLANHRAEEKAVADAAAAAAAEAARALENAKKVQEEEVEKEAAVASGKAKNVKCIKKDCKRRGPSDCPHKMCFLCCYETRCVTGKKASFCTPHLKESLQREEENRYIESMLYSHLKPRPLPRFCEEKFTASGQTVVIWCLRDFVSNKAFCEETLQQEERKLRQQELLKKRERFRDMTSEPASKRSRSVK